MAGDIETRLVYGLPDAGKTTYIRDCIANDPFTRRGRTLVLCFERGQAEYGVQMNTNVALHDGKEDVRAFCLRSIEQYAPERIYVEMNTAIQNLRSLFPDCMKVSFVVSWIDGKTLERHLSDSSQILNTMVGESNQVTFRNFLSKEELEPYSQTFRLMNPLATYLRQDPMGYHEKAFDIFLPFDLEDDEIRIRERDFLPLWLDAFDHPEHYAGKTLHFTDPIEVKRSNGHWAAGRVVMTCCMADLQFMSFELSKDMEEEGWINFNGLVTIYEDEYRRKKIKLDPQNVTRTFPPISLIIDSKKPSTLATGRRIMRRLP